MLWTREQIHAFAHSAQESSHFADSSVFSESLSEALQQLGKQGVRSLIHSGFFFSHSPHSLDLLLV